MKIRFSVVTSVGSDKRVGVVGSLASIGAWKADKCLPLSPMHATGLNDKIPSMWTGVIEMEESDDGMPIPFEYKYIQWVDKPILEAYCNGGITNGNSPSPSTNPLSSSSSPKLRLPEPEVRLFNSPSSQKEISSVEWEDYGNSDNRIFMLQGRGEKKEKMQEVLVESVNDHKKFNEHVYNSANVLKNHSCTKGEEGDVYVLPVAEFHERSKNVDEYSHTTKYYLRIKDSLGIHFNQIIDRVYVGTCPRSIEHVLSLKQNQRISDFINFQTPCDIVENWIDPTSNHSKTERTPEALYKIFDKLDIRYVWLPTTDMCSNARARTVAQAAFIMAGLMARKDFTGVYIHCNAGVGRSVACVVAYIYYCLGVPLRLTNLLVNAQRPVAFFDESAAVKGFVDFGRKFGEATKAVMNSR